MDSTRHILVESDGSVLEVLQRQLQLSETRATELLRLGSIYLWKRRLQENWKLTPGDYLRVHLKPLRFECAWNWSERIVVSNEDYLIVDKPKGLPVHPTLDNANENLIRSLEKFLSAPLYVTHRLDRDSEGLIVIAKNPAFQKHFNANIHQVQKIYSCTTEKALSTGRLTHYMKPSLRAPRVLSETPAPGWKGCELEVLESIPLERCFGNRILLLTGRTHQIRAQLATLANPILGDTLYGSPYPPSLYRLACVELSLSFINNALIRRV